MKNRKLFIIINFLYLAIPLLILFFPILFRYKFYILVLFGIIIYFLIKANNISNDEIGITKNNIFKSFINNLPIISVSIFIIILMRILNLNKVTPK